MKIQVNTQNVLLADWMRELMEQRIQRVLGRFTHRVEKAIVTFEDLNGPRGGLDTQCRLRLLLRPRGEVNVSAVGASVYMALRDAAQRAKRRLKTPSFEWKRAGADMSDRFQFRELRLRP
jgi:ribosome-associated translation inhibitor RaiA